MTRPTRTRVTFRPIERWPHGDLTPAHRRKSRRTFQATYAQTHEQLQIELNHLEARDTVIQLAVTSAGLRRDNTGLLASTTPDHPGVVVSIETKHGHLRFATDRFSHWHANLRAIALGLGDLRRVDRYGITQGSEQYTGWLALPPGNGPTSYDNAVMMIATAAGCDIDEVVEDPAKHIRRAKANTHPDAGGTVESFEQVVAAAGMLQ